MLCSSDGFEWIPRYQATMVGCLVPMTWCIISENFMGALFEWQLVASSFQQGEVLWEASILTRRTVLGDPDLNAPTRSLLIRTVVLICDDHWACQWHADGHLKEQCRPCQMAPAK